MPGREINEGGVSRGSLDQDASGTPLLAQGERADRRQALADIALGDFDRDVLDEYQVALALFN